MEKQLSMEDYDRLPVRQWMYLNKAMFDRNIAAFLANQAADIRDYQRWHRVAKQLDMDIERIGRDDWRP